MKITVGGDRLGSGKKMKQYLHNYERANFDLSYLWKSTMAPGTLVPFINELALPGDTFNINLNADVKTIPTLGPLFGSFKLQMDVFTCPIRLYNKVLHNNTLNVGLDMQKVLFPIIEIGNNTNSGSNAWEIGIPEDERGLGKDSLFAYLGMRHAGSGRSGTTRYFNGLGLLSYWDIYKNYYANKQEEEGCVMIANLNYVEKKILKGAIGTAIDALTNEGEMSADGGLIFKKRNTFVSSSALYTEFQVVGSWTDEDTIDATMQFENMANGYIGSYQFSSSGGGTTLIANEDGTKALRVIWSNTRLQQIATQLGASTIALLCPNSAYNNTLVPKFYRPSIARFPLKNIDDMRESILSQDKDLPFEITTSSPTPYSECIKMDTISTPGVNLLQFHGICELNGLGLKTYQNDIFNNFMNTEWIDGAGGINAITKIDTSDGLEINTLILAKKVFNMLTRVAISGGSYQDWIEAVYTEVDFNKSEIPIYQGGLSKEIVFQEIISNAATEKEPLGALAGRGTLGKKHKGGYVRIKVSEPSIIMGIVSITPRIDYSQGNKWHNELMNMSELHVPALDAIGFQDLLEEDMAGWTKWRPEGEKLVMGKQPSWTHYMTNVNQCYGNFARPNSQMFMTLNRNYEEGIVDIPALEDWSNSRARIKDATTYIDPSKYNYAFADTSLTAQNFWVQIAIDMKARRKMSAKQMPNL